MIARQPKCTLQPCSIQMVNLQDCDIWVIFCISNVLVIIVIIALYIIVNKMPLRFPFALSLTIVR